MNTFYTHEHSGYDSCLIGNLYSGNTDTTTETKMTRNLIITTAKEKSSQLSPLHFKTVTFEDMHLITPYLNRQESRTTDFSYGGILMWVDVFNYEYCIYKDTLFIKGAVEDDLTKPAFSMPLGELPLAESVKLLKEYCDEQGIKLEFSAVPLSYLEDFRNLEPAKIEELEDWADYLYDAEGLATLKGKKLSKKRNHVNRFMADYHDHTLLTMTPENAILALKFMDLFDLEGDDTEMAIIEREQTRKMIKEFMKGDNEMQGALLLVDGKVVAFTIGDIVGDTLFIHIEKALRAYNGSYETINTLFARKMLAEHPDIRYINREDDSGDPGLRKAKESYHPITLLRKYNVIF